MTTTNTATPAAGALATLAETIARITAAIARPPRIIGNSNASECASRAALVARRLLAKLSDTTTFYAALWADCEAAHPLTDRKTIIRALRAYHAVAFYASRSGRGFSCAAAQRALAKHGITATQGDDGSAADALAASRPVATATALENDRAARGYAILKARGAFD